MTLEKADTFVKELVEKGRLTVEEGKELQSELKRKGEVKQKSYLTNWMSKQNLFNMLQRQMFPVWKINWMLF